MNQARGLLITSFIILLIISFHILSKSESNSYADADPGWMVFTTQSIVKDFDLDIKNQLNNDPLKMGGQVSLGKDGEWFPLHEWLISVIAAPFYLIFGDRGTLICNVILSFLVGYFMYKLCIEYSSPIIATLATTLTFSSSILLHYSYSFSIDVLGVLLATISLYLLHKRKWFWAGLYYSMTVFGRNFYLLILPAYLLYIIIDQKKKSDAPLYSMCLFILGGLPFAIIFLLQNFFFYGSPFLTAYNFWIEYNYETEKITHITYSFNNFWTKGLFDLLLSPINGLCTGIPLLPLGILLGLNTTYYKSKSFLCFFVSTAVILISFFAIFGNSYPGSIGNRYLIFFAPLSAILLSNAIEKMQGSS